MVGVNPTLETGIIMSLSIWRRKNLLELLAEHFPLERVTEAYHLLHDGKIQGRAVMVPNG
jgi:alcohol dehydrogenase, propanol-preferring